MDKRAQGLPITTVILAILGIVVLVILFAILTGRLTIFAGVANECPGTCVLKVGSRVTGPGVYLNDDNECQQFEKKLLGGHIAQVRDANNKAIPCNSCCMPIA